MKENTTRHLHLNMALIGGFMGGYALTNHHDIFGSAQTSNMITIAMNAAGRPDANWLVRIFGLFLYMAGLASTVVLPKKFKMNMKLFSIIVDGIVLILIGFFPSNLNDFVALYPLFIATSIQWCSFPGADGYVSASIFSTNNLRQFTTAFAEYFCSRDTESLRKGKFYGKVLLCYHIGVIAAYLTSRSFGLKASLLALLPVCTAFFFVWEENRSAASLPIIGHLFAK